MKRRSILATPFLFAFSLLPFGDKLLPPRAKPKPYVMYPTEFIRLTEDVRFRSATTMWPKGLILLRTKTGQYAPAGTPEGSHCIGCIELIARGCWEPL